MAPKISKTEVHFEQVCKELDLFRQLIRACSKEQQSKIKILKSKVKSAESRLAEIFQNFTIKENEDNLGKYLKYQEIILDLLVDLEEKTEPEPDINAGYSESKGKSAFVKLPKFDLPHFWGDSETWISFKELFSSTVLKNENLSNLEKLQYLHSSVRGNAAKIIRGFSLKEENLKHCWDLLCERFENKRLLALSQINKIFSTKIVKAYNSKTLLELVDTCNESIRNLNTLGLESNSLSDLILIQFMVSKLEQPLKQRWELTLESDKIPDLDAFRKFIEREARSLEDVKGIKSEAKVNLVKKSLDGGVNRKQLVNSVIVKKGYSCVVCSQTHALFKCPTFNKMPVFERWKVIELNKLCQNCLRQNHQIETCRINVTCKNCGEKHHTLLHVYAPNNGSKEVISNQNSEMSISNTTQCYSSKVLLSTALINVKGKNGKISQCKALIDNASQNSLITRACAERLALPRHSTSHSLVGVNCMVAETFLEGTEFEFTPHFSAESFSVNAFVVDRVTSPLPNFHLTQYEWPHIKGLQLADPNFFIQSPIDVLLGADIFSRLIFGCAKVGPAGTPTAFPSKIGWLLCGQVDLPTSSNSRVVCHTTCINNDTCLQDSLQQFFNNESLPSSEKICFSEDNAEQLFVNTTTRTDEGKYIVRLPFRDEKVLGESKGGALQRFYTIEKKLIQNPDLRKQYIQFMREYIDMEHMTLLNPDEESLQPNYFLPHHGVVNEHSTTTKLRVVFDASYKSSNQKSLNDVLLKGPKLQKSIFDILLKFRSYPVAFTADIAKMYRQIFVAEEDRQYQRIFWRESLDAPIKIYKLNTITYGTSCAPYLAIRTIQKLCEDESEKFPLAAEIAKEHFYVDDLLAGGDSIESAKIIIQELQSFMHLGGFPLRKWACSHPEALSGLPESAKADSLIHCFDQESSQRVLGIFWDLKSDCLQVRTVTPESITTKRQLLSQIAQTYDPLGLIAPATILLKIILQELWSSKVSWDEPIPPNSLEKWLKFQSELHHLKDIQIPRYIHVVNATKIEIHGFCDASAKAYAAVAYLRVISDTLKVSLIAAKTRVAPLKHLTLPRLELSGALLLAELVTAIQKTVKFNVDEIFLWCDSSITLSWITNPPAKGNQFVKHRVEKIKSLTTIESWRHIPGKQNPADAASRGLFPKQLKASNWFVGPPWLHSTINVISNVLSNSPISDDHILSGQEDNCLVVETTHFSDFLLKYSSYLKLVRIVAWIFRFYNNSRSLKVTGPLQSQEIAHAKRRIVKLIQATEFLEDIRQLKQNKPVKPTSKLSPLNVFLDSDNILRVGGRLSKHKSLTFDQKHPMLIPKHHHLSSLIIQHFHKVSFHGGQNLVLALVRQEFWIPDGRSTVRKALRNCIHCFKLSAKPIHQMMGDLPESRISVTRPFEKVGVDYAGPIFTKCQHQRKATKFKSYLCLFICMCTKAVHLELVTSLSTDGFLASLRRFIARRGYPSDIFSDNGRNFVGANSYLKSLIDLSQSETIQDFSSAKSITWHFMPPYAPNFGGLWEASVKLAKRHLLKTCQSSLFTFEELSTLLCQIEACINSRPLVALSPDANDVRALSPGHFLIGAPLMELPETNISNTNSNTNPTFSLSSRYRLILQLKRQFWTRWSRDYLSQMMSRPSHHRSTKVIKVGDLALIQEDSSPPLHWKLGRVVKVFPGKDNVTRVVELKVASGIISRPVSRLAILPISSPGPARC